MQARMWCFHQRAYVESWGLSRGLRVFSAAPCARHMRLSTLINRLATSTDRLATLTGFAAAQQASKAQVRVPDRCGQKTSLRESREARCSLWRRICRLVKAIRRRRPATLSREPGFGFHDWQGKHLMPAIFVTALKACNSISATLSVAFALVLVNVRTADVCRRPSVPSLLSYPTLHKLQRLSLGEAA